MKKFYRIFKSSINYVLLMFGVSVLLSFVSMIGLYMEDYKVLQGIFGLLFLITYVMLGIVFGRTAASEDFKRTRILESRKNSGEVLSRAEKLSGYSHYKGYVLGLICSAPLIILLIICVPMGMKAYNLSAGVRIMYFMFYLPVAAISIDVPIAVLFYAVGFNVITLGVFYNLYGIKLINQRRNIQAEAQKVKDNYEKLDRHIHKSENDESDKND